MVPNSKQLSEGHMRVTKLGLILNLVVPALIVLGGIGLRNVMEFGAMVDEASLQAVFWALVVVAAGDLGAVMFLKTKMLRPPMPELEGKEPVAAVEFVVMRYLVIFVIALSPAVMGLVYFMLGGTVEDFVLFGVISLLIYRLVRPKREFFDSLFGAGHPGVSE